VWWVLGPGFSLAWKHHCSFPAIAGSLSSICRSALVPPSLAGCGAVLSRMSCPSKSYGSWLPPYRSKVTSVTNITRYICSCVVSMMSYTHRKLMSVIQRTSQVLCLCTRFPYKVLSLSTKLEVPWCHLLSSTRLHRVCSTVSSEFIEQRFHHATGPLGTKLATQCTCSSIQNRCSMNSELTVVTVYSSSVLIVHSSS
jgi:lysylphosphatidylglycerol synthetase-like protein (DUF2156 family)